MPDSEIEVISKEWLQSELRSGTKVLIILDCRSSNEFLEGRIRSAVNFSIPSIMLRRLAAGKIDITSTIKCSELKNRIQSGYSDSVFVLYNDTIIAPNSSSNITNTNTSNANDGTINVLHRKLKQDGCHVVCLEGNLIFFYNQKKKIIFFK